MPGKILGKPQTGHPTAPPAGTWRVYEYDGALYFQDVVDHYKMSDITALDIGLDNVTNDAQLKRSDNDWVGYSNSVSPDEDSIVLIELPGGAKRKATLANIIPPPAAPELPSGYMDGCTTSWFSVTQVKISSGVCRDAGDDGDIQVTSTLTAAITTSGANGLDTGSEASDTWYFIFVCSGASGVAALLSTSQVSPTLPAGYDESFRLVGSVYNDSGSDFRYFFQKGAGRQRRVCYNADRTTELRALSGGSATTWTAVDVSEWVPTSAITMECMSYADDFLANFLQIRPYDYTGATQGTHVVIGISDGNTLAHLLCNSSEQLQYAFTAVGGNAIIDILGYVEEV